jgi:hypothetical protein
VTPARLDIGEGCKASGGAATDKHQPGHDTSKPPFTAELTFVGIKAPRKRGATVPARRCALDLRPAARAGRPNPWRFAVPEFRARLGSLQAVMAFPSWR